MVPGRAGVWDEIRIMYKAEADAPNGTEWENGYRHCSIDIVDLAIEKAQSLRSKAKSEGDG